MSETKIPIIVIDDDLISQDEEILEIGVYKCLTCKQALFFLCEDRSIACVTCAKFVKGMYVSDLSNMFLAEKYLKDAN